MQKHQHNFLACFCIAIMLFANLLSASMWPIQSWDFNDPGNLLKATEGIDLVQNPNADQLQAISNGYSGGAARLPMGNYLKASVHDNSDRLDKYTLFFEIRISSLGNYQSLLQTNFLNLDDADLFISPAGKIGSGPVGYTSESLTLNKWHQVVLRVQNGPGGSFDIFIDGVKKLSGPAQANQSRWSLGQKILLFADNGGECGSFDIDKIVLWTDRLSLLDHEIPGLYKPQAPIVNAATNVSFNSFTANWSSGSDYTKGYRLDVATDDQFVNYVPGFKDKDVGLVNSWPVTALAQNTKYYYRVRAYSDFVPSNSSSTIPVTTLLQFNDINAGLPGVNSSSVAWGDYDNDGDLDILITGYTGSGTGSGKISKIYRNDNGTFTDINAGLTGVNSSSAAWGDYDNDGDLDILITGAPDDGYISKIYRNDNGAFTDINAGLVGVQFSSVAWGDYDNDGDLDILITGEVGTNNRISKIYRNDTGAFTDINAGLIGVELGSVAWGDYDNDGDLDILITGYTGSGKISQIYRNDNGAFTDINAALPGVYGSSVAWGDYDNDGDLDILITGLSGNYPNFNHNSKIYRNDNGTFTDINAALPGVNGSSVAWGDYDSDGDLDILITGYTGSGNISQIYRNDNGDFTDISAGLIGVDNGSAAWGDYDNDGDLDILITGGDASYNRISKIYRNDGSLANTAPTAPTNLAAQATDEGLVFSWNKATDTTTPQNALSYNIAIGNTNNPNAVKPAHANLSNGWRKVVAIGNTAQKNSYKLNFNLPQVNLKWAVQAVDNSFAGSGFAGGQTIKTSDLVLKNKPELEREDSLKWELPTPGYVSSYHLQVSNSNTFAVMVVDTLLPIGALAVNSTDGVIGIELNSLNNLNKLLFGSTYYWRIKPIYTIAIEADFSSVPNSFISRVVDLQIPLVSAVRGTTVDVSNPMAVTATVTDETGVAKVEGFYKLANQTAWTAFTMTKVGTTNNYTGIIPAQNAAITGKVKFKVTDTVTPTANSGESIEYDISWTIKFTDIDAGLTGGVDGSAVWGDYDNDGDLDILITGYDASNDRISKIYRNDNGAFTDINAGLPGVNSSSAAWGDYDNDGDLDILITGQIGTNNYISKIYRNDNGAFNDINAGLPGVYGSSVDWGDYDNDGDLDILITGAPDDGYISKIYRNDNGAFTDINAGLTGVADSSVDWGDYDNDGDLDILITGLDNLAKSISKIYRNDNGAFTDINAGLTGVTGSSVAWGDYDNDGDLDILLSGLNNPNISQIYRNDGNNVFVDINAGLAGVSSGSAAWGDYDNDGDLDILLTGPTTGSERISKIYRNDNGAFTDINAGLTGVYHSSVAWGDYDNDGDLDILIMGASGNFPNYNLISKIYRNGGLLANTAPTAPTNLAAQATSDGFVFSWNKATDTITPQNGLSYNIVIGSAANPNSVKPAHANLSNGWRKVAAMGNTNQKNSHTLKIATYPQVKYSWSVQAIDNAFAGSLFATSQAFGRDLVLKCDSVMAKTDSLFWESAAISKISKYQIQVAVTAAFDSLVIDSLLINHFDSTAFVGKSLEYLNKDNRLTNGKTYYYRVKPEYSSSIYETAFSQTPAKFKYSVPSGIDNDNLPLETKLYANYPNPFNPITKINYDLRAADRVKLVVYNAKGELVKTLVNGNQPAGRYSVSFDGAGFNSGVYFYKLEADGKSMVKRMLMVK